MLRECGPVPIRMLHKQASDDTQFIARNPSPLNTDRFHWAVDLLDSASRVQRKMSKLQSLPAGRQVGRLLGELGIPRDSVAGRRQFERQVQARASQENPDDYKALRRGWCLGDNAFRKELLGQMAQGVGSSHDGAERQESGEEKAERIVTEELKQRRWTEATLRLRRKGDSEKVKIAARLRQETIMTLKWIARRLQMGSWTHVSNCLAGTAKK
jgi:hypothetical protein